MKLEYNTNIHNGDICVYESSPSERYIIRKEVQPGYTEISYEEFMTQIVNKEVLYELY